MLLATRSGSAACALAMAVRSNPRRAGCGRMSRAPCGSQRRRLKVQFPSPSLSTFTRVSCARSLSTTVCVLSLVIGLCPFAQHARPLFLTLLHVCVFSLSSPDSANLAVVQGVAIIPPARWKLRCKLCNGKGAVSSSASSGGSSGEAETARKGKASGACVQCCYGSCVTAFHVSCGRREGYTIRMRPGLPGEELHHHHPLHRLLLASPAAVYLHLHTFPCAASMCVSSQHCTRCVTHT